MAVVRRLDTREADPATWLLSGTKSASRDLEFINASSHAALSIR